MDGHHVDTVVIGGSQSGLAVGYHLKQQGLPFVILEACDRIGDAWRNRYDSLRLFTPRRYNALPGMPFPESPSSYPTKDEAADYLEAYAHEFELPVRTGVHVDRLSRLGDQFEVSLDGSTVVAENVVVATGVYHHRKIPPFARDLGDGVVQLHSRDYRNRSQLQPGPVLVVGAANSGSEVALDLAPHHRTWLSGRDPGQEPSLGRPGSFGDRVLKAVMWAVATRVLVVTNPLGRKARDHFLDPPRGIPLGGGRRKQIRIAGIERVPSTVGVQAGHPVLEDGTTLEVANVVWCTGYTPDYAWIDLPLPIQHGFPVHDRGVVESIPGLYFVGLLFLRSLSSALLGGVGRDAAYIAEHIASARPRQPQPQHDTPRREGIVPSPPPTRPTPRERRPA
ncbi:MAG: NAD(P)/FAD-dependent oxidoreductase [Actinomycetota bacterium]|nr:NAD(P)/FAD-dependent oxidoreductase [Actinomycetota bacterium]